MGSDQARKIVLGLNELSKKQTNAHLKRMEELDEKIYKAMTVYDRILRDEMEADLRARFTK